MPVSDYTPTLADVGSLLTTRTRESNGEEAGTFTTDTDPTAAQVNRQITRAVNDLRGRIGPDLPTKDQEGNDIDLRETVKSMAVLRVAMYIELVHFPEQVKNNMSPYASYKQLYDEGMRALIEEISELTGGGGGEAIGGAGAEPMANFPDGGGWDTRRW